MYRIQSIIVTSSLLLFIGLLGFSQEYITPLPDDVDMSTERMHRVDAFLQKQVDEKKFAGFVSMVARMDQVVHCKAVGMMDIEANKMMQTNTIFRIYSMSKPITVVAIMMLYEEGLLHLDDPVSKFIPEFKAMKVFASGTEEAYESVDTVRDITIHDLLTHTSGLTYGGAGHPVQRMLEKENILRDDQPLRDMIQAIAKIPLMFQPGSRWEYSCSIDVLGYLVEVISGKPLPVYLQERIFEPLEMKDTGFVVPAEKRDRFAQQYHHDESGNLVAMESKRKYDPEQLQCFSGGGGLVSTAEDYMRFLQMMINDGVWEGNRLISRKSIELIVQNHVSKDAMPDGPQGRRGYGFGFGVAVLTDLAQADALGTEGSYNWGGAASTSFWIDPKEDLVGLLMTQYMPYNEQLSRDFKVLVYQAIDD